MPRRNSVPLGPIICLRYAGVQRAIDADQCIRGASRRSATCYDDGAIRRVRVVASMEKPMLYSIVTPILVFLFALGASYFITRPIGDRRRHTAAAILSVALGTIGGFLMANMAVAMSVALGGAFLGMMIAWRQRNPLTEPHTQSKSRKENSRRPHYGISQA
jgi:hypothetical protein